MISHLSRLGFGLSSIAGSGNYAHQEKIINTAIENGITHFDVAPYYGSGDAERILGRVLTNCKASVTITTKFGLTPLTIGGSYLRTIARPVFRYFGGLKKIIGRAVSQSHHAKQDVFIEGSLLISIDESLKKIGRPIDILLLHDLNKEIALNESLIKELEACVKNGKIKYTGVSGDSESLNPIFSCQNSAHYSIVQLENSLIKPGINGATLFNGQQYLITHRAIQGGLKYFNFLIENRPGFKPEFEKIVDVDISDTNSISQLLIELSLYENPSGTVLFSSTKPERIASITKAISKPILNTAEQAKLIRCLFDEVFTNQYSNI